MPELPEIWLRLVDEPIGTIVRRIQQEDPEIGRLVGSPHRILPFRTFAHIRAGIALGQLLFEQDLPPYDGSERWVDELLADRDRYDAIAREVRAVAEEIAADPSHGDEEPLGPDDVVRERFRKFAHAELASE